MEWLSAAGFKFIQPNDLYKFSADAVALGNFVTCTTSDLVLDIGAGTGVLSFLIAGNQHPRQIIAVEINPTAAQQMEQNLALNHDRLTSTVTVLNTDARDLHHQLNGQVADVLVCNPPYYSTGKKSLNPHERLARHDETLTLTDLATIARRNVKTGGKVYFCYPAEHLAKAITIFENAGFRIKEINLQENQKGVYLVLICAKKGGGHHTVITR